MDSTQPLHKRTLVGHPVDVATGIVFTAWEDFSIPGPFPLVWRRFYNTSYLEDGPLGKGWITPFSVKLKYQDNRLIFLTEDATEVVLEVPEDGERINHSVIHHESIREGNKYIIWNWHNDNHKKYIFDIIKEKSEFRLVRIENLAGHGIDIIYTGPRWTGIIDNGGRVYQLGYNIQGLIDSVVMSESSKEKPIDLVKYDYDDEGRLAVVLDRLKQPIRYIYDNNNRLIQEINRSGGSFHFEYDTQGRCIHNYGDDKFIERYLKYDPNNNTTSVTDSSGNLTIYEINRIGLINTITDPLGSVYRKIYDENGFLIMEFDPIGSVTQHSYDTKGHLVEIIDKSGATTKYEYNDAHRRTKCIYANFQTWTWEYNNLNQIIKMTTPTGEVIKYFYNSDGLLEGFVNDFGYEEKFCYDDKKLKNKVVKPDGTATNYRYDKCGKLVSMVDYLGNVTEYVYDANGNWIKEIRPDGTSSRFYRDASGHIVRFDDRQGNIILFERDRFNQLISRTDPLGHRVAYAYDNEGRITTVINELNEVAQFEYDQAGRLIQQKGFDDRKQCYFYDNRNLLVKRRDGAELEVQHYYDQAGRIIRKQDSDGGYSNFAYDEGGRLIRCENKEISLEIEYSPSGQIAIERQDDVVIKREYNSIGQRTTMHIDGQLPIRYEYDEQLRLITISQGSIRHGFEWDSSDRLITQYHSNGATSNYFYNEVDRLIRHVSLDSHGQTILQRSYYYNDNDDLILAEDSSAGKTNYEYNSRRELVKHYRADLLESFHYDPAGNIQIMTGKKCTYEAGNRLKVIGNTRLKYDDRGNLISSQDSNGITLYQHNSDNQITKVIHPDGKETTFVYDPLGRRIRKTHGEKSIQYIWDGDTLLYEDDGEETINYIFYPNSFLPLSRIDSQDTCDFLHDQLGTPIKLMNSNCNLIWSAKYTAYGVLLTPAGVKTENPFRFLGQYYDIELGLHYNRWRYYDPQIGRFISQDPLFLQGFENLYRYAVNPINWTDPYGLTCGGRTYDTPEEIAAALNRGETNIHASSAEVAQNGANQWFAGSGVKIRVIDRPQGFRGATHVDEVIGYGRGNQRRAAAGTVIFDRMVFNGRPHSTADFGTNTHGPHIKVVDNTNDLTSHIYYP